MNTLLLHVISNLPIGHPVAFKYNGIEREGRIESKATNRLSPWLTLQLWDKRGGTFKTFSIDKITDFRVVYTPTVLT